MKSLLILILILASAALAQTWTTYDGVSIPTPPAEHPRLYLRARDLPDLQRRTTHPALKPVYDRLATLGRQSSALGLEYDALRFLLTRDEDLGRRTATSALKLLEESTFDMNKQDITRPIGRLMVTGSIVYDWTYPVLTAEQKARYVERLRFWATKLECGYPPPRQAGVTGHYSEWMLMRDMLSAGVAIYDEFPEMYQVAANRFFSLHLPVRNWWYQGGAFHQGSAYAETRASSELYPLWIFARMGFGGVYDPAQARLPYEWIYERRPDGQLLRNGDGQFKSPGLRSLLNASFYHDGYVLTDWLREPRTGSDSLIFEFLWRDPDLQPKPIAELPLTHYMGTPYGWMVARSGWGDDAVVAEMKVNEYNFTNHQHLDAGAFQLYYKGALAIDSGIYEGTDGGYGSPHDVNYNKRTIAHNSLLIYDPAEAFTRGRATLRNDGGQRFPNGWREPRNLEDVQANYRTGEVLGHTSNDSYAYLHGDITRAYSDKARKVERSFVFLNLKGERVKAALIVFDRVIAANPEFKRYWLLHSIEEPKVEGNTITVQHGGKLVDQVLLPAKAEIASVGGEGKEFWVFGENLPSKPRTPDAEVGAWRVEVASTADSFLNVMQMMDPDVAPLAAKKLPNGVEIANTTVLFENPGTIQSRGRFLIAGIAEGAWRVRGPITRTVHVSRDEHALWFEGPAGAYTIEPLVPQSADGDQMLNQGRDRPGAVPSPREAYVAHDPPTGLTPAMNLTAEQRRDNFEALWRLIDTTYAHFKLKSIDWKTVGDRYRAGLDHISTDAAFYKLLAQLISELKDTHSAIQNYRVPMLNDVPDLPLDRFQNRIYVIAGDYAGWEVMSVDGLTVADKLESLRPELRGFSSDRAYLREASRHLLLGDSGSTVRVELRSADRATKTLEMQRKPGPRRPPPAPSPGFELTRQKFVHHGRHPSGLGYIRIESFSGREEIATEFDIALDAVRDTPGLLLDIRDNSGGFGQPHIVGRLLTKRALTTIAHTKTGPGHNDLSRRELYMEPVGPWQYKAPIALLVSDVTGSASDLFTTELRRAGRVTTIGTTTHGNLSGVASFIVLPCGLIVRVSNGYLCDAKDRPIEVHGNVPDVTVEPTIGDFLARRDPVLERAVEVTCSAAKIRCQ